MQKPPLAFLITFAGYGARVHGCASGSVDRQHNRWGTPVLPQAPGRERLGRARMVAPEYRMDARRRSMVLDAIVGVCRHRDWTLLAAHARSNHVHVVVAAESAPERMLNDFKAYASRALGAAKLDDPRQIRWARHGSTRWLLTAEEVEAAVRYVVHGQGAPMAVWALGGAGVATAP